MDLVISAKGINVLSAAVCRLLSFSILDIVLHLKPNGLSLFPLSVSADKAAGWR